MIASLVFATVMLATPVSEARVTAHDRAVALVAQLGHPSFKQRSVAVSELSKLGSVSLIPLRMGLFNPDLEIAHRCQKLLPGALDRHLTKQIEAFFAKTDGPTPDDLPGVKRWVEIVGTDNESRKSYALLLREQHRPLTDIVQQPERAGQLFADYMQEVWDRRLLTPGIDLNNRVRMSDMLLFFFVGADPNIRKNMTTSTRHSTQHPYLFLHSNGLMEMLKGTNSSEAAKKLYLAWLSQERDVTRVQSSFERAANAKLKEAVPIALRLAADKTALPEVRSMALLGTHELFEATNFKELEELMCDKTVVGQTDLGNQIIDIELRDIALLMAIFASKQSPAAYGYERFREGHVLSYNYYFFSLTDKQREDALKKWQDWKATQKK